MAINRNFVFYRGPSMLDGAPIVAIATLPTTAERANSKTGVMVQTWVMHATIDPVTASNNGADISICGWCPHRGTYKDGLRVEGSRACYVQLYVPGNVWSTWQRGSYDDLSCSLPLAASRIAGEMLRLGSYGDPAAVPYGVWRSLMEHVSGHAGYTHQWAKFPEFAELCMASVDGPRDRAVARMLGFRTFRVAGAATWSRAYGEVLCAASEQAGKKTTCSACKACGGNSARARADIVIPAHGGGRRLVGMALAA